VENNKIKQVKKYSAPLRTPQGTLARTNTERAHAFAKHLAKVFQPHPSENEPQEEEALTHLLETYQLKPPIKCLKRSDVQQVLNILKQRNRQATISSLAKSLRNYPLLK
jgi:hypothetical protein